jgi:hypothetical protein
MEGNFEVLDEVNRQYRRFKAQGNQLKVRLLPPPEVIPNDDSAVIPDDDDSDVIPDKDNEVITENGNDVNPENDNDIIPEIDNDNEISPDLITHFERSVSALFE